jgi:hypothetical protein
VLPERQRLALSLAPFALAEFPYFAQFAYFPSYIRDYCSFLRVSLTLVMRRSGVQIPEAAPKETPNDLGGAKRRLPEAAPKECVVPPDA